MAEGVVMRDKLMKALDIHQPDWWITHATQQDLQDCVRLCTDGSSGTIKAKEQLRRRVADRFYLPINAAIEADIVRLPQV